MERETRRVIFHPAAERELRKSRSRYEEEAELGALFAAAVKEATVEVSRLPGIGSPIRGVSRAMDIRRVSVTGFPYMVVYRTRPTAVHILAVAHMRRRPEYWTHRLEDEDQLENESP